MPEMDEERLRQERDRHEDWLSNQPGFTGVGIGTGTGGSPCLVVYTNQMQPAVKEQIRQWLKDVPVDFEETGEFRTF